MRTLFTKKLKHLFIAVLLLVSVQKINSQCSANFIASMNANGNVQFLSTSTPTPGSGHFWNFGNSQTSSLQNPNITYTANGVYTVCLSIWTPTAAPTCSASICQTINVTTAPNPTCLLNASFTQTTSANSVTLASNSTGTVVGSTYTWYYGDATQGSGDPTTHTYASPGFYNCKLVVNNGSGCIDSVTNSVFVNGPCNLNASFTANQLGNGNVQFVSTSTGTTGQTTYNWYKPTYFGSTDPITTNFINGTYTVTLYASNNSSFCASTSTQVITVTSNTCNLVASFVQTVVANSVSLASTSAGTVVGSTYTWHYGDATQGSGNPTTHTYANSPGNYMCYLVVNNGGGCVDSISNIVSINVPCNLNASFVANQLGNGNVQFVSTSTGTTALTQYMWWPNPSPISSFPQTNPSTTTFSNGTYTITFVAVNGFKYCNSNNNCYIKHL